MRPGGLLAAGKHETGRNLGEAQSTLTAGRFELRETRKGL